MEPTETPVKRPPSTDRIEWQCEVCKELIEDGTGYVWMRYSEACEVAALRKDWEGDHPNELTFDELLDAPGAAQCHQLHYKCRPNEDDEPYGVEVHRLRTPWSLLSWSSHLLSKIWVYESTDWLQVMARVAREHGGEVTNP